MTVVVLVIGVGGCIALICYRSNRLCFDNSTHKTHAAFHTNLPTQSDLPALAFFRWYSCNPLRWLDSITRSQLVHANSCYVCCSMKRYKHYCSCVCRFFDMVARLRALIALQLMRVGRCCLLRSCYDGCYIMRMKL